MWEYRTKLTLITVVLAIVLAIQTTLKRQLMMMMTTDPKPRSLQTTDASMWSKESSHTVPQTPRW